MSDATRQRIDELVKANPILLFIGADSLLDMVQPVCTALLGVFLLAMATIGFYRTHMNLALRGLALVGALGLLTPGSLTDAAGFTILLVIHLFQTYKKRNEAKPLTSSVGA